MSKYVIWDKQSPIYTVVGEVLTPEQWISRYGWINNPKTVPVVAGGLLNGAFCGELSEMVSMYMNQGADFTSCITNQDKLDVIEAFEIRMNTPKVSEVSTPEERIAAALEYQNLLASPVVNNDDPDVV